MPLIAIDGAEIFCDVTGPADAPAVPKHDAATFERARPLLAAFGKRIEHLGPVGAGSAMKAVNNALLAVNILGDGLRDTLDPKMAKR